MADRQLSMFDGLEYVDDAEQMRSGLETMDYVQMRRVVRWYESRKQKEA